MAKKITDYTMDDLRAAYSCLYGYNEEAAEEDYLEYYESEYGPGNLTASTPEEMLGALQSLAEEILNDTGDEALTKEWICNSCDDDLVNLMGWTNLGNEEEEED